VVTEDGNGEKLVAKGTPATFKQTDEEQGELVAKADEIIYLVEAQILQLNGNARFEQGGSLVQSGTIEFDLAAQRVKADGDQSTGGRVTTTLKTKKNSLPE
jgi:lipopolysaccharide export system protein LptA